MKKKVLAVFLSLLICIGAFAGLGSNAVFAASSTSGSCGTGVTYSYNKDSKVLTISGSGSIKDYYPTTGSIGRVPWYDFKPECVKVVINEGITGIGDRAFYNMSVLTSVTLPSTLKTISDYSFAECPLLNNVTLPSNLQTIRSYAFQKCTSLTKIVIPDSVKSFGKTRIGSVETGYVFADCTNLKSVTFGTGLTSTGNSCFRDSGVSTVTLPDSITEISTYSFFNCKIQTIELPQSVVKIGTRSFANNGLISEVTVNNSKCTFEGLVNEDPFNGSQQSLVFHGHSRSTTQTYANEHNYGFVSLDPCAHDNLSEVTTLEPTCTEKGSKNIVCDDCGAVIRTEEIDALGHDFKTFNKADMTEADGHIYEYQECSRCGRENCIYTHNEWVEGNYDETYTGKCTTVLRVTKTCKICGKTDSQFATGHKMGKVTSEVPATCTEAGSQTGTCSRCGETFTQEIAALGHKNVVTQSYDTDDGHTYTYYKCSVCNEESTVCTHNEWVEGYYTEFEISPVSCTANGTVERTCTVCKKVEDETILMTGHDYDDGVVTKEPDCTNTGTKTRTCKNCGNTLSVPIAKLDHNYEDSEVLKEPTCLSEGTGTRICTRCGDKVSYTIDALGHDISNAQDYKYIKEPTCIDNGTASGTCANCGEVIEENVNALGHDLDMENQTVETVPTCTESGKASVVCKRCDSNETVILDALGHNYTFTKKSDSGETFIYNCTRCGGETIYLQRVLAPSFKSNINKNVADLDNGYRLDINKDGIINMRDYSLINGYTQIKNEN